MKSKLKVVFAGTPDFALPSLSVIAQEHDLLWVYTQPDAPRGRGQRLSPSPVKNWAVTHNVPCYQPAKLGKTEAQELVDNSVDTMIVAAYGQLIPVSVLKAPRYGCVNVHASLLPRWRGASPIQHAILHADPKAGVCIMEMEKGLDSGAVLAERACHLTGRETAGSLTHDLAIMGAQSLQHVLTDLPGHLARRKIQDEALVTMAPKLTKQDAAIDWQRSVRCILAHIRAFNPWPMAFTWLGNMRVKVIAAYALDSSTMPTDEVSPGAWTIINGDTLLIAGADGWVVIDMLQLPGKKAFKVEKATMASVRNTFPEGVLCSAKTI